MLLLPTSKLTRLAWRAALWAVLAALAGCGATDSASTTSASPTGKTHGPAPAPSVTLPGTPVSWDVYRAIAPSSMTVTTESGRVVLEKAGCLIMLWPTVPTAPDADAQALAILTQKMVSTGQAIIGELGTSPLDEYYHLNGIAGEGWTYVDLRGHLVSASNHNNEFGRVRLLLANLGARSAVITGFQPWNATSKCLDELLNPYEWSMIFYSLSFPSYQGDPNAYRTAVVGGWSGASIGASISFGWGLVYASNGRYSDTMVAETFHQLSPTEYLDHTSGWTGNGAWDVAGSLITTWPDDATKQAKTERTRLFTEHGSFTYLRRLGLCDGVYCEGWATKDK